MEIIIAIAIVLLAGFIIFRNLRNSSKGKCAGCTKDCSKSHRKK